MEFNVSQHMGWHGKALARRAITKIFTRGSGVNLGHCGQRYRIMPFTEVLATKYRDAAVLTSTLAAMPAPTTFSQHIAN